MASRAVLPACLLLLAAVAGAEPWQVGSTIPAFTLEDQHGEKREVGADVRLLLFTRDMKGGDLVKEVLRDADAEFLASRGAVYVSDIHRMPGLVARMMAIPSMRRRGYPMLLDRKGSATSGIPSEEKRATLVALDALRVTGIDHFDSADALREALVPPAPARGAAPSHPEETAPQVR